MRPKLNNFLPKKSELKEKAQKLKGKTKNSSTKLIFSASPLSHIAEIRSKGKACVNPMYSVNLMSVKVMLHCIMNAKLAQHSFWPCHVNSLIGIIPTNDQYIIMCVSSRLQTLICIGFFWELFESS